MQKEFTIEIKFRYIVKENKRDISIDLHTRQNHPNTFRPVDVIHAIICQESNEIIGYRLMGKEFKDVGLAIDYFCRNTKKTMTGTFFCNQ